MSDNGKCIECGMDTRKVILVWRFKDAPKEYQELSSHGGDEDWLAFIPASFEDTWMLSWMEEGSAFGCAGVSEHVVDGGVIRIGAHA